MFFCLVIPYLGSYSWLAGRIHAAQTSAIRKMKKAIPAEEQMVWKFSLDDARSRLSWEHSREFEFKGEMYDVLRSETHGDSVTFWCYWDRKETKLRKQRNLIAFNLMGPSSQDRQHHHRITEFFNTLYITTGSLMLDMAHTCTGRRCLSPYAPLYSEAHSDTHSPPPWQV